VGTLYLNHTQPGMVIADDHGEPHAPMVGIARSHMEEGRLRHVAVRVAFSDDRADEFLRKEAKQLPKDAPGVVMIDASKATSGMRNGDLCYNVDCSRTYIHTMGRGHLPLSVSFLPEPRR
jgi:hypothetical protein